MFLSQSFEFSIHSDPHLKWVRGSQVTVDDDVELQPTSSELSPQSFSPTAGFTHVVILMLTDQNKCVSIPSHLKFALMHLKLLHANSVGVHVG